MSCQAQLQNSIKSLVSEANVPVSVLHNHKTKVDKSLNFLCKHCLCRRELMEAFHDLRRLRLDASGGRLTPILELD